MEDQGFWSSPVCKKLENDGPKLFNLFISYLWIHQRCMFEKRWNQWAALHPSQAGRGSVHCGVSQKGVIILRDGSRFPIETIRSKVAMRHHRSKWRFIAGKCWEYHRTNWGIFMDCPVPAISGHVTGQPQDSPPGAYWRAGDQEHRGWAFWLSNKLWPWLKLSRVCASGLNGIWQLHDQRKIICINIYEMKDLERWFCKIKDTFTTLILFPALGGVPVVRNTKRGGWQLSSTFLPLLSVPGCHPGLTGVMSIESWSIQSRDWLEQQNPNFEKVSFEPPDEI